MELKDDAKYNTRQTVFVDCAQNASVRN